MYVINSILATVGYYQGYEKGIVLDLEVSRNLAITRLGLGGGCIF